MDPSPYRVAVFALYQLAVLVGIVLMPIALVVRQFGIPMPFHRVISRLERAYEHTNER